MGEDWTKAGHLGLTASTGQLSDNHDVIRLETYVSSEAAEKGEQKREQGSASELDPVRYSVHGIMAVCGGGGGFWFHSRDAMTCSGALYSCMHGCGSGGGHASARPQSAIRR